MLAARGDLAEIERSFEAGADDCLIQPILRHDLLAAVQRVLHQVEHKRCTTIDCIQT
jgi:DNA-binding response OmpR family regulator